MNDFTTWASKTLAELETLTETSRLTGVYCHDHIRILRAAVRHGDELLYDIEMASLDGDAYRWEELSREMRLRDAAAVQA